MKLAEIFKQYLEHLFLGRRFEARRLILDAHERGKTAFNLLTKIVWPAMEQVDELYRNDYISRIVEHMATRINRQVADQLGGLLARKPKTGRRIVVASGNGQAEELSAQIVADLFEAEGWNVWFLGAGVPNDEILKFVGYLDPDVLCVYGTIPSEAPAVRKLIDLIRDVGVCEEMQILVGGGVFNRADGLAEEIHADLFASDAVEALEVVAEHPLREPVQDVPQPGRRRKPKKPRMQAAAARLRRDIESGKTNPQENFDDAVSEAANAAGFDEKHRKTGSKS